ncbi:rhodanese-like domain-containing protein [Halobacillus shinanisalinarum]|uniref:Rhodanese-like domain-containing protein n=1 Tax=Halobacillus shinanisalinarum TaxID=2932258 RepID=A0ABY4H2P4_9BACI|nr:rhodanese-like domain-containing protein [Halobacillus shinanisalinarum]UOQ94190.1 rhodanese-like domain-containing protein [Halobacillus shinanisalinarum]
MELILFLSIVIVLIIVMKDTWEKKMLTRLGNDPVSIGDYCVIDIRDYISASHSPYPGAENIPLSYLPRELKDQFDCPKNILLITDDKRGAKIAAKIIRKKRNKLVYYIKSA